MSSTTLSTTWTSGAFFGLENDWYAQGNGCRSQTYSNWSNGVPVESATGSESVLISGAICAQPVISPCEPGAPGAFTVQLGGYSLREIQIDGLQVTLTDHANLTMQGVAIGNLDGTSGDTQSWGTLSGLTAATGATAAYDANMQIAANGLDTVSFNDINENFGQLLASGAGNTLNITITPGGHWQSLNGLVNYGLIEASDGGVVEIGTASPGWGASAGFADPGWIEAIGGTFETSVFILDDANLPNSAGTPDGYIEIGGTGGEAVLLGGAAPQIDVLFLGGGSNDKLVLANNNAFQGSISGFAPGDSILLTGATGTPTLSYDDGILTVAEVSGGNTQTVTLNVGPGQNASDFAAADTPDGILITDIACFAAGTHILTPDGDVPVQDLRAGDDVLVTRGDSDAIATIIWTGSRTVDLVRHPHPDKVTPVRILAGALGAGLPERDLVLSPDHCLFIDGHLIEAKTLVNGATVIRDATARFITYHHIETETHDVVLAEGQPVETYLDAGNRDMFDGGDVTVLHPDFAAASRPQACAALVVDGPVVRAVRQRLLNRARAVGFAATEKIDLMVKAGVEKLPPQPGSTPQNLVFRLSRPLTCVELLSSAGVPAHLVADPDDRRTLGAAITGAVLHAAGERYDIKLDDPAHQGFYDMEAGHRWTNGAARLALPAYAGRATLEIQLNGQAARWTRTGHHAAAIA